MAVSWEKKRGGRGLPVSRAALPLRCRDYSGTPEQTPLPGNALARNRVPPPVAWRLSLLLIPIQAGYVVKPPNSVLLSLRVASPLTSAP